MVLVTDEPIDTSSVAKSVAHPGAGAVVTFEGVVRDHDHGRDVAELNYESHPSAQEVLESVASETAQLPDVICVSVVHRVGPILIGEAALVASVATAHRAEAFRICETLVNLTKDRLPVWKHQVFTDGTEEWVNCA